VSEDNKILWKINDMPKSSESEKTELIQFLNNDEISKSKKFHESFPQYKPTPLVELNGLADKIGVKNIFLKDESYRFGLNAFKVLGGSFAMAKFLAQKLGKDIADMPYDVLISDEVRKEIGDFTFVTATDGNHGRGVAWTANQLKQNAVVYMPTGSSETRLKNILAEGANAEIMKNANYDACVRLADDFQKENPESSVVVQDTAWEGYEEIPAWIMQGYGTMAMEAIESLKNKGVEKPTHIFLQAGVGSLAAAVQGLFAAIYGDDGPIVTIVEPHLANCFYVSALAGERKIVGGDMLTLMAGLACGEPNTTGWEIIKNYSTGFVSCPDTLSANGMRILAAPTNGDTVVKSGESGAVTTGVVYEIMTNDEYKDLRAALKLDENSVVLLFSTEGDTDPQIYEDVVWKGRNKR